MKKFVFKDCEEKIVKSGFLGTLKFFAILHSTFSDGKYAYKFYNGSSFDGYLRYYLAVDGWEW